MHSIQISLSSEPLDIGTEWEDLIRRTPGNVFMHPAALNAARDRGRTRITTLLAWDKARDRVGKLIGLWALEENEHPCLNDF
jgi:hypothetical protein